MKPFDPRLLIEAPAARRPLAALAGMGVLAGTATVATAFALSPAEHETVDELASKLFQSGAPAVASICRVFGSVSTGPEEREAVERPIRERRRVRSRRSFRACRRHGVVR